GFVFYLSLRDSLPILGMTFKTLPFIVWMHRYAPHQGRTKTPMPKDLVPRRPLRFLYGVYGSGFVVCLLGLIVHWPSALRVGAIFLGLAALIFVILCFQIVFGTVRAPKKTTPNHA